MLPPPILQNEERGRLMRTFNVLKHALAILAVIGLAACASSGGGGPGSDEPSGDGIAIQVRNDLSPPIGIMVWVVPENASRRRLGFVSPNGSRSFSYEPSDPAQQVRLLAVPEGPTSGTMGRTAERQSNQFSILDVQSVGWTVSQMNVRIGG
jgi:hypothetical protein